MHSTPNVGEPFAEATPARTGVPFGRLLSPAGVTRCSTQLFESAAATLPSTLGPSRERTANAGAVALPARSNSCDRRKGLAGPTSARPRRPGSPTAWSRHLPTETLESRDARRKSSHPFGAGAGSQPKLRPPGTADPGERTPEEALRRTGCPLLFTIALPARGSNYIYRNSPPKILAYSSNVIRNTRLPQLSSNFPRIRAASRLKDTPIRAIRCETRDHMKYEIGLRTGPTYCSYGTNGCENSMAETESSS